MKQVILILIAMFLPLETYGLGPGDQAPPFASQTYDGRTVASADFAGKTLILEWFNSGCPFVRRHYVPGDMQKLQREAAEQGAVWLTIISTNPKHKDFLVPEKVREVIANWNIASAAVLADQDGAVGRAFGAKTTPHIFIIKDGTIEYSGAVDDDPSGERGPAAARNYVREALSELAGGRRPETRASKPYGCAVKY